MWKHEGFELMTIKFIPRKAHFRKLKSGRYVPVRAALVAIEGNESRPKPKFYGHPCPICGSYVNSVKMPNGGWAHFERAKGLRRVKHSCLHLGDGLSGSRDDKTPDLFEFNRGD